jgi:NADH-ubiquinone oxidoreductase chain 2
MYSNLLNIPKYFYNINIIKQFLILEYSSILLFVVLGASLLINCKDFVTLFICLELQSYGIYILCALYKNSEQSITAALMYFLLGALASSFVLFSTSLMYINSSNLFINGLQIINTIYNVFIENYINNIIYYGHDYNSIGLLIISVGLLFKISAAPFHI